MRRASAIFVCCFWAIFPVYANPTQSLFDALEASDATAARKAIDAGANLRAANRDGDYPLHVAARRGNAIIMEELIEAGAQINSVNLLGQTALHVAAAYGNEMEVRELIRLLADVGIRDSEGHLAEDLARHHAESDVRSLLRAPMRVAAMRDPVRLQALETPQALEPPRSWFASIPVLPMAAVAFFAFVVVKGAHEPS